MMEIEVPKIHDSQQDMDLIDILWRQDIDLGARREVFDYSHRQKEHALQRQRELEEEKQQQLVREQEKALLAQLQLDEETGEYVPRPPPTTTTPTIPTPPQQQQQPAATPLAVTQDVNFTENGDALSFDECMQLLAETFPLVETTENASACLDTAVVPAPNKNQIIMSPEQPALLPPTLSPAPLIPQRTSPDLEQAWMELLSLPELQNCLNMPMEDTLKTTTYPPAANSPKLQDPSYTYYPLPNITDAGEGTVGVGPPEFIHTFEEAFPIVAAPDQLTQMAANPPQLNTNFIAESFCDVYYPNPLLSTKETNGNPGMEDNGSNTLPEVPNKPPYKPAEIQVMSPEETFDTHKQEVMEELLDTDSGISLNTSPNASSPEKPGYSDGSYSYSDSDMDELDISPGSVESDYSEMFSLNFQPDDLQLAISLSVPPGQLPQQQEKKTKEHKTEPVEETGYSDTPFTKDKQKRRSEVRLSRDEQRAKALQIPFTVDMIINLPVDDFNEMMSKHQLNEAQLALVRDIRRRGKNKVAAQNCRKRKMENIVGLEYDLDSLNEEKDRLLREKSQQDSNLRKMKQQLNTLYLEVFSVLRDEQGNPYSPSEYSLQQTSDGSVFLVPRIKKTLIKSKDNKHLST